MSKLKLPLNQIHQGDCITILNSLPAKSVDLIFADPPYNLQLEGDLWRPNMTKVDAVNDEWDQFESFATYDQFTRDWLTACRRVLKDEGTIWVIGSYHNIYRVGTQILNLGYWILNDIVWVKTNPMPNFRGVRFTNAHETLLWAKKSKEARYTFNYHTMKSFNDGKQMRSDWIIPICAGTERIRVNGEKAHSTQKPELLLERVILSSSNPGDVILDPFFGTGTTGAVAKRLHRNWIGIERDPCYVQVAQDRIDAIRPGSLIDTEFAKKDKKRKAKRIPFTRLVKQGLLKPGQSLYFQGEESLQAQIQLNGKLHFAGYEGSIHQVAQHIQGGSPVNGWELWYFKDRNAAFHTINTLREQIRQSDPPED